MLLAVRVLSLRIYNGPELVLAMHDNAGNWLAETREVALDVSPCRQDTL
jgi:hypothetical protein